MFFVIFLLYFLRVQQNMANQEDCTVLSSDVLHYEKKLSHDLDNYLNLLLKDSAPSNKISKPKWTHLAPDVYVYSAFIELCPPELATPTQFCVKFIGITLSNSSSTSLILSTLKCAIKNHSTIYEEEFATIQLLPENHDLLFTAAFLFCPLKSMELTHASLYEQRVLNLTWLPIVNNLLPQISNVNVHNHDSYDIALSQGISLCVRPLFHNLTSLQFSEFIAYYSTMGVDHFIFYYLKSFTSLHMLLEIMKHSKSSYDIFLWDIPLPDDLIHQSGQIIFSQDCIARSKNKFGHTIVVDLDEYVVPQVHKNIKNLVSYLDVEYPLAGSYVIPMVLFCGEYFVQKSNVSPFHFLNRNKRQKTHWQHQYRSKYIVKPDRILYTGIHFTWKLAKDYTEINVSPNVALLNHYRKCCGLTQTWFFHLLEFKALNDETVEDNILKSYATQLMNNDLIKFISNVLFENVL